MPSNPYIAELKCRKWITNYINKVIIQGKNTIPLITIIEIGLLNHAVSQKMLENYIRDFWINTNRIGYDENTKEIYPNDTKK